VLLPCSELLEDRTSTNFKLHGHDDDGEQIELEGQLGVWSTVNGSAHFLMEVPFVAADLGASGVFVFARSTTNGVLQLCTLLMPLADAMSHVSQVLLAAQPCLHQCMSAAPASGAPANEEVPICTLEDTIAAHGLLALAGS
jgi:hypothetical protein